LIVVQGFGPFGTHSVNPSELLVRKLAEQSHADLVTEVLPTSMDRVRTTVPELVERHQPSVWIGVGLAAGRTALSIEAVAVNLAEWGDDDADADGASAQRQPIFPGGPAAHPTTLPVQEILDAWKQDGIPGYLSLSAGSYLCNWSMYCAAHAASELGLDCRVGFLHLPQLPELVTDPAEEPSMAMALQARGLELVIEATKLAGDSSGLYPHVYVD
jgi:pyroglutamyl-peptidase